jgi:hypothetical protein
MAETCCIKSQTIKKVNSSITDGIVTLSFGNNQKPPGGKSGEYNG